jgi:hypothetical protein
MIRQFPLGLFHISNVDIATHTTEKEKKEHELGI